MTRAIMAGGTFRLVLPGTWVHVPLGDPTRTRAFAKRVVAEQVGRADRHAALRRDAVLRMCDLATSAHESGAHTLLMATELMPGVPFAASMVARDTPWPTSTSTAGTEEESAEASDAESPLDRLAASFPEAEIRELRSGPGARTTGTGVLRGKEQEVDSVEVVYRLPRIDSDDLLLMRFTAPAMGENELIASLFDAMADSLEWVRARVRAEDAEPIGAAQ